MPDPVLLNCKQLASKLSRSPTYITSMKAAGYTMNYGNRTTLNHALAWLKANPLFRSTHYVTTHRYAKEPSFDQQPALAPPAKRRRS